MEYHNVLAHRSYSHIYKKTEQLVSANIGHFCQSFFFFDFEAKEPLVNNRGYDSLVKSS